MGLLLFLFYSQPEASTANANDGGPLTFTHAHRTRSLWYTVFSGLHRGFPLTLWLSLLEVVYTFPVYSEGTPRVCVLCYTTHHVSKETLGGGMFIAGLFRFSPPSTHHFAFPFYCTNSIITIHKFPQVVCVPPVVLLPGTVLHTLTHSAHGQRGRWLKCVCVYINQTQDDPG